MAEKKDSGKGPSAKEVAKEIAKLQSKGSSQAKSSAKEAADTVDQAKAYLNNLQAQRLVTNEISELEKTIASQRAAILDLSKDLTKEAKQEAFLELKILKAQRDQAKLLKKEIENQLKIADLNKQFDKHLKSRAEATKKLNDLNDKYNESVKEGLGFIDDIDDTIKNIPIVGNFLSKAIGLDKMKEELTDKFTGYLTKALDPAAAKQKEAADAALEGYDAQMEALGGVTDGTKAAGEGAAGIGGGLKSSIPGALGLNAAMGPILIVALAIAAAIALFKKALEVDQEVTDLARGLGTSKDNAKELHSDLTEIATNTKVIGANTKELSTAYTNLATSMGVTKLANAEMAESQVLLTKHMGMAAEDASAFQQMSMAGGKSAEQNMAVIKAGVESMTGGLMSYKDVAKDIAKSSKAVQASYKGNIAALTKAVVTAKKFGMTLDDTKKSADSLLDIESSLEAEMKANVLTGKHMNLNAARELALKGDTAGAMDEMMKQAGGYDEMMKMAPYQQKALAEAMGMTTEEMIKAAETQKNMNSIAEDLGITIDSNTELSEEQLAQAAAMGNEEAKKLLLQEQQASAQEKMSAMGDKLMAVFSKMAEPIMGIIDPFIELVDTIMPALEVAFQIAMYPVKMALGWVESIVKLLSGDFSGAGDAFIGSFTQGFGDEKEEKAEPVGDGVIGGAGTMIKSPKGTYKLADEDTIIAGTELGQPGNGGEVLDSLRDMLSKVKDIDEDAIDDLEDLFEDLQDAFDELDIEDLTDFANLAGKDLSGVGEALAAGINSLGSITDEVDLGDVEDVFEDLEDALGELDLGDLVAFAGLADKDLSGLGASLAAGINSLGAIGEADLGDVEDVFDSLEDVIAELDLEELDEFMNTDFSKLEVMAQGLQAGIIALSQIKGADLSDLEDTFDVLEDAIDELDIDELKEFLELDLESLTNLASAFNGGGGGGGGGSMGEVVKKLDELIAKVDQPLVLNIGSKAISEIETQTSMKRSISTTADKSYGTFGT